jgi:hypothetical protein
MEWNPAETAFFAVILSAEPPKYFNPAGKKPGRPGGKRNINQSLPGLKPAGALGIRPDVPGFRRSFRRVRPIFF